MLSKVGFFHFGENHEAPIESLRSALSEHTKQWLARSLIVLPEAFNIPTDYWGWQKEAGPDCAVKSALETAAREFNVIFVAGLLDGDKRSSAYLVDGHVSPIRICHKVSNDQSNRYEPLGQIDRAERNPIRYEARALPVSSATMRTRLFESEGGG